MNSYIGLIQQGLFFAFFITLIIAFFSRLLFPTLTRRLITLEPATQSTILLLWSCLPFLAAFGVLFLALLPSILQITGLSSDHCLGHLEGHIHFCLIHRPAPVEYWLVWAPGLLFVALLIVTSLNMIVDIWETIRFKRNLDQYLPGDSNQKSSDPDQILVTLNTETPLALTCGLLKQKIFISKGLVDRLTDEEQLMLLAHENAHVERNDAIKKLMARSLSFAHFPAVRKSLLSQLNLACEQACDLASSMVSKDPGKVAELLLKVERIYQKHLFIASPLTSGVLDYSAGSLSERVTSLLECNQYRAVNKAVFVMVFAISMTLIFSHDIVHDVLEHFMFLIADLG